jgi:hypothetical protein
MDATDLWAQSDVICANRADGNWCWGRVTRHPVGGVADACPSSTSASTCAKLTAVRTTGTDVRRLIDSGTQTCALMSAGYAKCAGLLRAGDTNVERAK